MDLIHLRDALENCLISKDADNHESEPANLADVIFKLANANNAIAKAICPQDAAPGHDAAGGSVASLTEAVMGVTAGLCRIADAIESLATSLYTK